MLDRHAELPLQVGAYLGEVVRELIRIGGSKAQGQNKKDKNRQRLPHGSGGEKILLCSGTGNALNSAG